MFKFGDLIVLFFLKEHIYGVLSYRNAQLNFAEIEYDVLQ